MANHTPGPFQVRELIPDGKIIRRTGSYEIGTRERKAQAEGRVQ